MANLPNRYSSSFPGEFFARIELNARFPDTWANVEMLWQTLSEQQSLATSDFSSDTTLRQQTVVGRLFYRGQSNHGNGLSSSLHRLVANESTRAITEELLGKAERSILHEASSHGLDKNVSPGELLMMLQHHQAPTRLLDVSLKPLEALYFAVERADAKDGRLFVVWLNDQPVLKLAESDDLPWTQYVLGGGKAASKWTQSVRLVDERPLDPRMRAQEGRFLVGGVQRAYANLNIWHTKQLRVVERQKISMLCIGFLSASPGSSPDTKWPALGWTVRIPAKWKPELRARLAMINISHESMYPDLGSIEWRSQRAARDALSSV